MSVSYCVARYDGIRMSPQSKYNSGYWGQECGPEHDPTPERRYKYMEDALSVNTGQIKDLLSL
jgi:hypothetical protein